MINNPPPSTFESFNLSSEPSLSSWVIPQEQIPQIEPEISFGKLPDTPKLELRSRRSSLSPAKDMRESSLGRISESPEAHPQDSLSSCNNLSLAIEETLASNEPGEDFTGHVQIRATIQETSES